MNAPVFTKDQLHELMRATGPLYDIVRLVDPGECRILYESSRDRAESVHDSDRNDRCFSAWGTNERCYDCTGYQAAISGRIQEKIENIGGDDYRVVCIPVMQSVEGKGLRSCCMEFIKRIDADKLKSPDNDEADDGFDAYESRSEGRDVTLQIMEAAGRRSNTGIVCYDKNGRCIYVNASAFRLFHIHNDCEQMKRFLDGWLEEDRGEKAGNMWIQFFRYGNREHVIEVQHYDIKDAAANYLGSYFSFLDVTPLTAGEDVRTYKKDRDALTGIYNWEGFVLKAQEHIDKHGDRRHMLIRINVREFKLVNQLFGMEKGNNVLRSIALMCRDLAHEGDVFGRIQGDQFIILCDVDHFEREAYRRRAMELSDSFGNNLYKLHIQFGIYRLNSRREDISIMSDRAKMAMRSIAGDHPVSFAEYNNELMLNTLYESEVVNSFADAVRSGQLHIYLQPQNDGDGKLLSAEVLARWIHPDQGVIPPDRFISILERANIIHELDMHIWEKAVRQLYEWRGTDKSDIRLSVNISPKDITQLDLVMIFTGLMKKYDIHPSKLNLEITETALMADPERCINLVNALQREGFQIEIDDFGSGYSSLNLLKDVHANILKIDRAFLQRTEQEKRSEIILTHIINMARDLNMGVITEGVETRHQLEMLHALGCNIFQGYYFSKPIPVSEFEKKYF